MRVRQALLERLSESTNGAVETAVEAALMEASGKEQEQLAGVLVRRNRRAGWIALIRQFDRLSEELQHHLLENPLDLFGPLSDAMDDGQGNGRLNVIEIVRKSADPKLVFLVTDGLTDVRQAVREQAAEALVEAIRKYLRQRREAARKAEEESQGASGGVDDTEPLRKALDFGLRQYKTHRHAHVVLAALMFERQQDGVLWGLFNDSHDEMTKTAVALLRTYNDADLAGAMWLALGSGIKAAAVAGISACVKPEQWQALACESYRLLDPVLAGAAEGISHPRMLHEIPEEAPWDERTWSDYLRIIEAVGMDGHQKLPWLRFMLDTIPAGLGMRAGKMMVLRAMASLEISEAYEAMVPMASDADEVVARSAARYVLRRKLSDWRSQAAQMLQSPHESVRKLVSQAVSPGQFDKLWNEYLKLPPAVQVATTRALSTGDSKFSEQLRAKLGSTNPVENAQGLKMLLSLSQLKPYREQIITLCGHPDARIVATAVRLVSKLEDPRLRDLLEAAAKHHDPRVRANAIESMESLNVADRSQQVLAMLTSRYNRERANAIKAISKFDFITARECLLKMLTDPAPQHRVSALWVVGQLDLLEVVRQVGSLARRDPNQHVRRRAEEMLARLQDAAATASVPVGK